MKAINLFVSGVFSLVTCILLGFLLLAVLKAGVPLSLALVLVYAGLGIPDLIEINANL